jgi:hypothetical protein
MRPRKDCPTSVAWAGLATSTPRFYGVQEALACVRPCTSAPMWLGGLYAFPWVRFPDLIWGILSLSLDPLWAPRRLANSAIQQHRVTTGPCFKSRLLHAGDITLPPSGGCRSNPLARHALNQCFEGLVTSA